MRPVCSLSRCHGSRPLWQPACSPWSFLFGWGDDILPPLWRCRSPLAFRASQACCSKKRKEREAKDKYFIRNWQGNANNWSQNLSAVIQLYVFFCNMLSSLATCLLLISLLLGCYEGIAADVICCRVNYISYLKAGPNENTVMWKYFLITELSRCDC